MARVKEAHEQVVALATRRWGDEWRAKLAEFVGVTERTVRRWGNGETRVPGAVLKLLGSK